VARWRDESLFGQGEGTVISGDKPFERRDQRRSKNVMQAHHGGAEVHTAGKINVLFASTAGITFLRASERDCQR
jgi:hypothetical protein